MVSIKKVLLCAFSLGVLALVVLAFSGCASVGPPTIARDRFDYVGAIGDSWKQQMLLNLVKVRYSDTPIFLDVASVINQYSLETGVNVAGQVAPEGREGDTYLGMSGQGRYTDRPTITYTPVSGEAFARRLLRPLTPSSLLTLIEGGYPIDLMLKGCVHSVNGIRNRFQAGVRTRAADPEFYPLLERLKRIQSAGVISLRFQTVNYQEEALLSFRGRIDPYVQEDINFVKKTLGLDPTASEYRVVYGTQAKDDKEIAVLSRSLLDIMGDLASYIDVPAAHVKEKRVRETVLEETAEGYSFPPLIEIQSSANKPENAFISIPYRDYWFWIDDRDQPSKSVFTFLMFLFLLTETGGRVGAPVISISAGG
jgi:hypothetical protein